MNLTVLVKSSEMQKLFAVALVVPGASSLLASGVLAALSNPFKVSILYFTPLFVLVRCFIRKRLDIRIRRLLGVAIFVFVFVGECEL